MLKPSKTIHSLDYCSFLQENWIKLYGSPTHLLTDQGKQFVSNNLLELCAKLNINKVFSTTYNPTGNSIAERINGTITTSLLTLKNLSFKNAVQRVEDAINNSFHSSIGMAPSEFIKKTSLFDPLSKDLTHLRVEVNQQVEKASRNKEISFKQPHPILIVTMFLNALFPRGKW